MKFLRIVPLLFSMAVVSCGQGVAQLGDLATQAMERALAAEAPVYAVNEFSQANDLYNQMGQAFDNGDQTQGDILAQETITAANLATDIARQNKATQLVAELKEKLSLADQIGFDESNPNEFQQATQYLIDSEAFYQASDYESTIIVAEEGLSILAPYLNSQESLALSRLNRARSLYDQAQQSTDLAQTQGELNSIRSLIDQSSTQYEEQDFTASLENSQEAIDRLEALIAQSQAGGRISVNVNQEDNIQMQSYDLIRRLSNTIQFIKDNGYTNAVYVDETPSQISNLQEVESENSSVYTNQITNEVMIESSEETPAYYYEEGDVIFSSLPLSYKAQNVANQGNTEITVELLERYQSNAQAAYDSGNYLNAADLAREGLRLADLYLAGQHIAIHTVIKGDTLWDISGEYYNNDYFLWPNIWRANKLIIKDPDLIYPKQKFNIPPAPQK